MNEKMLEKLIKTKKALVCIIGLGYVGLPIAFEFVKKGYTVFGLENNKNRIENLKEGVSYITDISDKSVKGAIATGLFIPTSDEAMLKKADALIICVPTPLRKTKIPNISYVIKASASVAKHLRKGHLIILESTTYPGTTRDVILPIFQKTGLKEGKDFFLAFSPERIDPGNEKYPFCKIPKIVGGVSKEATKLAKGLYSSIINKVVPVSTSESAEVTKLLENTFRIVNIGLINEFAMLCHKLNINVWEVIEAAKTKPFGFMPFYPGPGIGGHCIPKDPLYLSWRAKKIGFKTKVIDLASRVNKYMPHYVVSRAVEILSRTGKKLKNSKILILGVTYKRDVNDLRESPALDIIELLQQKKVKVFYSDTQIPYLAMHKINLKNTTLTKNSIIKYDLLILVTDHSDFNYAILSKNASLILDTRNAFGSRGLNGKNIIRL